MSAGAVSFGVEGAVATLTFGRAEKMNALSSGMIGAIHERIAEAEARADIRAVILTGAGKAFSVGKDLEDDLDLSDRAALEAGVSQL